MLSTGKVEGMGHIMVNIIENGQDKSSSNPRWGFCANAL